MSEEIKDDLAEYICQFLSGKHKLGKAHKIVDLIWHTAYVTGYEEAKKDCF